MTNIEMSKVELNIEMRKLEVRLTRDERHGHVEDASTSL